MLKPGMEVRIVGNKANHNIPIGTVVTLKQRHLNNTWLVMEAPQYVDASDIRPLSVAKKELQTSVETLKKELAAEEEKLAHLEEIGTEEFDETEYKIYTALKMLADPDMSDSEKSKAIAKLIHDEWN